MYVKHDNGKVLLMRIMVKTTMKTKKLIFRINSKFLSVHISQPPFQKNTI